MKKNLGTLDRAMRLVGALGLASCAFLAPLPLAVRALGFGGMAAYLAFNAIAGTCFGYRMMGMSTCPVTHDSARAMRNA
jgi:hypothetical protein